MNSAETLYWMPCDDDGVYEYEGDDDGVYECGEYDGPEVLSVLSYSYSYGYGCPSAMPTSAPTAAPTVSDTIALSAASRTSAPALLCVCAALVAGAAALPF